MTIFFKLFKIHWVFFLVLGFVATLSPLMLHAYLNQNPVVWLGVLNEKWNLISRYAALFFFVLMGLSFILSFKKKKLFYSVETLEQLKHLSWQQFEELTAQIMRHLHYKVYSKGGAKADGGIDLLAYKKGFKYVIQCKHWRSTSVGVKIVREMLGVSLHEKAQGVYIFTCGNFTKDAREFAKDKKVYLVNGYQICKLLAQIKAQEK